MWYPDHVHLTTGILRVAAPINIYELLSFFAVLNLNGIYKGQILKKPVSKKIAARMPKIIAAVPVICPVKYKTAISRATTTLKIRSKLPIFLSIF